MTRSNDTYKGIIQRGQLVECSLYYFGMGVVVGIHGEQSPAPCSSVGRGVGVGGGNAKFDIVWYNGRRSERLPEAQVRGSVQWSVYDEVVTEDEIEQLEKNARNEAHRAHTEKSMEEQAFLAAKRALIEDPALKGLKRTSKDERSEKVAAANIRKELKAAFPGVKFSVRMSSPGSLHVSWTDGPTTDTVKDITSRYRSGSFDGMQDLHTHIKTPFNTLFGDLDSVLLHRDHSNELTTLAINKVWERYPGNLADLTKPDVDTLHSNDYWRVNIPHLGEAVVCAVRKEACAIAM